MQYTTIQTFFNGTQQEITDYVFELNWLIKDERFTYDVCDGQLEFWGNELSQDTILEWQIVGQVTQLEIETFNFKQDFLILG